MKTRGIIGPWPGAVCALALLTTVLAACGGGSASNGAGKTSAVNRALTTPAAAGRVVVPASASTPDAAASPDSAGACSGQDARSIDGALFGVIRRFEDDSLTINTQTAAQITTDLADMQVLRGHLDPAAIPACGQRLVTLLSAYMDQRIAEYQARVNLASDTDIAAKRQAAQDRYDKLAAEFAQIVRHEQ